MYHHLKILQGLITQDTNKQYFLTDEGRKSLDFLYGKTNSDDLDQLENETVIKKRYYSKLFSLPKPFYYTNAIGFVIFIVIFLIIPQNIVFFSFIPFKVAQLGFQILTILWIGISISIFLLIYYFSKSELKISSLGLFIMYYNFYLVCIIIINSFVIFQEKFFYQLLSLVFQVFYVITWIIILSYDCWTWEKSLITVLAQNYFILLFIS
ncbi:MAG: hypothetical protein HeimC3_17350 [Candidatus Heimdallarchaeota archaeon LC_3]|nr:MAG: hypothetical protein HeimC3_17350 [Candidatus Heimdallarchaeota archaeon LC_3]